MYFLNLSEQSVIDILQLGKAAQSTLIFLLNQSNGQYLITVDRENCTTGEKQKLKNGLRELRDKKLITKVEGTQGDYLIDSTRIKFGSEVNQNSPFLPNANKISKSIKQKETYGNRDFHLNSDKFIEKLQRKKENKKNQEEREKRAAETREFMWSSLKRRRDAETSEHPALINYIEIPGCDTKNILIACYDFLYEIVDPYHFYDVENQIEHENKLYKERFNRSVKYYENNSGNPSRTNLLLEVGKIIFLAKHNDSCIELHDKGKKCKCRDTCIKKLYSLLNKEINMLDGNSEIEAKDLTQYLREWFSEFYPELLL